VVFVDDLAALGDIEASTVGTTETFPEGANIEFVQVIARDRVRMRVHERGSGETLSCGTGACAVVAVHIDHHIGVPDEVFVEVPGGELLVRVNEGRAVLIGPAELVADGTIDRQWWESL
jgi:diaminopimelate epimerase